MVSLFVHIGFDMMSDLSGRVTETHALVKRGSPGPEGSAIGVQRVRTPEPDVVTLTRIGPER